MSLNNRDSSSEGFSQVECADVQVHHLHDLCFQTPLFSTANEEPGATAAGEN